MKPADAAGDMLLAELVSSSRVACDLPGSLAMRSPGPVLGVGRRCFDATCCMEY